MRNVLAHAGKQGRRVVAAFIGTAFAQDDAEAARAQWRQVADQLRPRVKKLAELMDEAESDVLAYMSFPAAHRPKLHSTNPIERVNGEIKRRTEVVGIFPNDEAVIRLVGAIMFFKKSRRFHHGQAARGSVMTLPPNRAVHRRGLERRVCAVEPPFIGPRVIGRRPQSDVIGAGLRLATGEAA